jgi:hypothetical protein
LRTGVREFSLHSVQAGSGAHPVSYPMGTGGLSPAVKRPGSETDDLTSFSAEVNCGAIYPFHYMSSWLVK